MAFERESVSTSVVVILETNKGIQGVGEARVMRNWGGDYGRYYGETPEIAAMVIRQYLSPLIVGADPFSIEDLSQKLDGAIKGYPYTKAAINMALYDIKGKALGIPVYELLGGKVQERIPLMHSIGIMTPEQAEEEATRVVEDGIRFIKIKVGIDLESDLKTVEAVRRAVGSDVILTVDANQGYRIAKKAIPAIREMERYGIAIVEQPVEGLEEMKKVTASTDVRVMADESCWNERDALLISHLQAADCLSNYVAKAGGISGAVRVAAVARAANLDFNLNGSGELGIGNAASVQTLAALPPTGIGSVLPLTAPSGLAQTATGCRTYLDDIVKEAYEYDRGSILVPDRPGLGMTIDPDKMEKYARLLPTKEVRRQ